jgi:hypothetical protein
MLGWRRTLSGTGKNPLKTKNLSHPRIIGILNITETKRNTILETTVLACLMCENPDCSCPPYLDDMSQFLGGKTHRNLDSDRNNGQIFTDEDIVWRNMAPLSSHEIMR